MNDLVRTTEVGVLIAQRVEAVWAGGDDLLDPGAVERLHVLAGEALERVLIAHAPRGISCARLAGAKDREVDFRRLEQLRGRHRGLASSLVEGRRTAHPEQHIGRGISRLKDPYAQPIRPLRAVGLRLAPGVGRPVDVAQHRARLFGKSGLDHHEVPSQVDDVVDVLDADRALAHACAACHAIPHDIVDDGVRHNRGPCFAQQVVAHRHHQQLGRQGLAGVVCGADFLAPAALGARHRVEHLLPGHVRVPCGTEAHLSLRLFEVDGFDAASCARPSEIDVDRRDDDVKVLRVGQIDEERQDDQHMRPDRGALEVGKESLWQHLRDRARERSPARRIVVPPERDLRRVPQEQRDHDSGDQAEDQIRLAEVTAHETRRPLHLTDHESGDDAGQDQQREDVDQERVPALRSEPGQGGASIDRANHRDQDRREQDEETPEDGRVHESRQQSLQELALTDHDRGLRPCPGGHVVEPGGGLSRADQPVKKLCSSREECDRDCERQGERDGLRDDHRRLRISAEIAGTISFRSPVTV